MGAFSSSLWVPALAHGLTGAAALLPILLVWTEHASFSQRLRQALGFGAFLTCHHLWVGLPAFGPFAGQAHAYQGRLLQIGVPLVLFGVLWGNPRRALGLCPPSRLSRRGYFLSFALGLAPAVFLAWQGGSGPRAPLGLEAVLYFAVLVPLAAEWVFRGFLIAWIDKWAPARIPGLGAPVGFGFLISTLVYFLAHFVTFRADGSASFPHAPSAVFALAWMGAVAGWLRARTGSLLPGFGLHVAFTVVLWSRAGPIDRLS